MDNSNDPHKIVNSEIFKFKATPDNIVRSNYKISERCQSKESYAYAKNFDIQPAKLNKALQLAMKQKNYPADKPAHNPDDLEIYKSYFANKPDKSSIDPKIPPFDDPGLLSNSTVLLITITLTVVCALVYYFFFRDSPKLPNKSSNDVTTIEKPTIPSPDNQNIVIGAVSSIYRFIRGTLKFIWGLFT